VSVEEFGTDGQAAATAYSEREREHAGDPNVEVVLVGADSLDTIRKTHSHSFRGDDDLLTALERHLVIASSASSGRQQTANYSA
jgi:hypothetical protein